MVSLTTNKHATKFRVMADSLQDQIDAKLAPRQTNTWRKIQQAESAEKEGRRLLVLQDKLRALADGWDDLSVPDILAGLSTKTQVDDLITYSTYPRPEYNSDICARLAKARITTDNYQEAREALLALGSPTLGEKTEKDELRELEREVARMQIPGFFPTPRDVGDQMLAYLFEGFNQDTLIVLEPSAGRGDLADALRDTYPTAQIDVCEINPDLRRILELKGYPILAWDFFDLSKRGCEKKYDRVLMNPPFENFQDIDHVMLAWSFVKPSGRLVAIMGEGTFFRKDKKAEHFRTWLKQHDFEDHPLPEGSFNNGDKPTGMNARIVVIDKPALAVEPVVESTILHEPNNQIVLVGDDQWMVLPEPGDRPLVIVNETDFLAGIDLPKMEPTEGDINALLAFFRDGEETQAVAVPDAVIEQIAAESPTVADQPTPERESTEPKHTDLWAKRTREGDIAFALAYPVDQTKNFWKDWTLPDFIEARSQEVTGKNRKSLLKQIERQIEKLHAKEADELAALDSALSKTQFNRDEYLRALEGQEVISRTFESVVGVIEGKIYRNGEVVVDEPTSEQLRTLFNELFENEFGTEWVDPVEEQRVADEAFMCERCGKHRALCHSDEFGGSVCVICADQLDQDEPEEPTCDPVVNGEQLLLIPDKPVASPKTMLLPIAHFMEQIKDVPVPPKAFIDSLRVVQLDSVLVRQNGNQFRLVDGRRRCKAIAIMADGDIWNTMVRADVFEADSWSFDAVMAIKANTERSHNVLNELAHIEGLLRQGYTEKQIAEATGMPIGTIRKRLKLTLLTPELREALDAGRIKPSVAAKAVNLPDQKQVELAEQEGRITGSDITEARQVQIKTAVAMWDDLLPPADLVDSHLSNIQVQALIETSTGPLKAALIELRTFRAQYGTRQEVVHGEIAEGRPTAV